MPALINNITSCQECVSGPGSSEVACQNTDGNTVDVIVDVQREVECQHHCLENTLCQFYTWNSVQSFPANLCVLLSSCEDKLPCHGCYSGPPECSYEGKDGSYKIKVWPYHISGLSGH